MHVSVVMLVVTANQLCIASVHEVLAPRQNFQQQFYQTLGQTATGADLIVVVAKMLAGIGSM